MCSVMLFAIIFSSTSSVFYSPVMAQGSAAATRSDNDPPDTPTPTVVPLWMRPQAPMADPPDITGDFQISQTVETGTGDNSFAYNGEPLTYTIVLRNRSKDINISDILLVDTLPPPEGSLDNESLTCNLDIASLTTCTVISDSQEAPLPSGNTIEVTRTKQLKWEIPTLNPGEIVTLAFSGQLVGKDEGDELKNLVAVRYYWGQPPKPQDISSLVLNIETRVRPQTAGGTSVSKAPVWFAEDWAGGTLTQDWADFDYDGDLDLALGSSLGTLIYRNDDGDLKPLWKNVPEGATEDPRLSYGLAWVQLDPATEAMELIVVGDSDGNRSTTEGYNYVYSYQPGTASFEQTYFFTTTYQLVRVVPGDFDGDGDVDLIGSSNWVNARCPVRLYRNDGSGHFTDTLSAMVTHDVECISSYATAALGAGDMDNDGDTDLALGVFPSGLRVLTNNTRELNRPITNTTPFTDSTIITIEKRLQYIPYDLKWGDFNQDGLLDLAAAYPLEQRVRVYKAVVGDKGKIASFSRLTQTLYTKSFMTPLALDWGDFSGDGNLDLIVADFKPAIYSYDAGANILRQIKELQQPIRGQAWSIRGADVSNKHNLNIAITNQSGASYMFTTLQPKLDTKLTEIPKDINSPGRYDIGWGNMDSGLGSDKDIDLVLGAAETYDNFGPLLYINEEGKFKRIIDAPFAQSAFGPHVIAIGDVNNDGLLDFAIGGTDVQIYTNPGGDPDSSWGTKILPITPDKKVYSLAWGDANDDGKLDLLVGRKDRVNLFMNTQDGISEQASYTITLPNPASSLAWIDYDDDHYLDFVVGLRGGATRLYINYGDGSFDKVWQSNQSMNTTSVAWADYDADGDQDLAVGNDGQPDYVWETTYKNGGFTLGTSPAWTAPATNTRTSKVAWGDWDSDSYPELAVSKMGGNVIVYANINYLAEGAGLLPQWQSTESYSATAVAWGDADGDGDLDLAISEEIGKNGYFQNTLNGPAHLPDYEKAATPLDNNPTYVYVERPGAAGDAYFFSTAEILAPYKNMPPTPQYISITYTLYDPEGADVSDVSFDYSLDGGGTWSKAPMAIGSTIVTQTTKTGVTAVYVWNAGADHAISDNARFRVCYTPHSNIGNSQHAKRCGISPPFRVRAISCIWPRYEVYVSNLRPALSETVYFTAVRVAGQATSNYGWYFDGTYVPGLTTKRVFTAERVYHAIFKAQSAPTCEEPRWAVNRITLCVGKGCYPQKIYIPLIARQFRGITPTLQMNVEPETLDSDDQPGLVAPTASANAPTAFRPMAKTFVGETAMSMATSAGYRTQRITNYALGVNSQPSINFDGSRIAFWSTGRFTGQNTDGNIEIFLADIKGDAIKFTQVTSSTGSILAGFNLAPTINYEGNRIAFFSDQDLTNENPDHNFEIFVAEVVSGTINLVQVTQTSRGANTYPSINAEGDLIAFASDVQLIQGVDYGKATGYAGIFLAHLNKDISNTWTITYSQVVTPGLGVNDQPALSADGRRIAFVSDRNLAPVNPNRQNNDLTREIFLAEIGGNGKVAYTQISVSDDDINESPSIDRNGTHIAFMGNSERQIYVASVTDAPITPNTSVTTNTIAKDIRYTYDQPHISADGVRVAYIEEFKELRALRVYDRVKQGILTTGIIGSDDAYPAISGDSKDVTYVSNWDIYLTTYPLSDLAITKTNNITAIINPGDSMTYTIVVSNTGPSPASDVNISDTVSVGIQMNLPEEGALDYTDDELAEFEAGISHGTAYSNGLQIGGAAGDLYGVTSSGIDTSGLVALWHLDEASNATIIADVIGSTHGFCGIIGYPPCPVRGADGKIRTGMFFDGNNGAIQTPHFDIGDNFAIVLWVYPRETVKQQSFIRKPDQLGASSLNFGIKGGQYHFDLAGVSHSAGTVSPGWQHVAVVGRKSGADTVIRFYKNGVATGEPITYTNVVASSANGFLGSWFIGQEDGSAGTDYYYGAMDELAIFNRELTLGEIEKLYNRQALEVAGYARGGYFNSRVIPDAIGNGWRSIAWESSAPYGKELPDEKSEETAYNNGIDMSNNVLLMHLNDPEGLMVFRDSSGSENDAECAGNSCPQAGIEGKFNTAVHFENTQKIVVPAGSSLANLTDGTWSMWIRYTSKTGGFELNKGLFDIQLTNLSSLVVHSNIPNGEATWTATMPSDVQIGQWLHVAVVRSGYMTAGVQIYINGDQQNTSYTHTLYMRPFAYSDASLPLELIGSGVELDEVAVFNEDMPPAKIENLHNRGIMQVQFQARSCSTPTCSEEPSFMGPGDRQDTSYSELNNIWDTPAFQLDGASKPYLQYRAYLGSNLEMISPHIVSVTVTPQVNCQSTSYTTTVRCQMSSQVAPLGVGQIITLHMPAQANNDLIPQEVKPDETGFLITNTVRISSEESDHELDNNKAFVETNVMFVPLTGVSASCTTTPTVTPGYAATGDNVVCCATPVPLQASLPITYEWDATGQPHYGPTNMGCYTYTWLNTAPGLKEITVVAKNRYSDGEVSARARITLEVRVQSVNLTTSSPTELNSTTNFTAAPAGGPTNVRYRWLFGDGATDDTTSQYNHHDYPHTGTFNARVNAYNHVSSYTDTENVIVKITPFISVTKTANPVPAQLGGSLTYTLRLANMCALTLTNLIVTDTLPATATPTHPITWLVPYLYPLGHMGEYTTTSFTVTATKAVIVNRVTAASGPTEWGDVATDAYTLTSTAHDCVVRNANKDAIYNNVQVAIEEADDNDVLQIANECTDSQDHGSGTNVIAYFDEDQGPDRLTLRGGYDGSFSEPPTGYSTLNANGLPNSRILTVKAGAVVTVENLILKGGNVTTRNGGGIFVNAATLVLSNSLVTGNHVTGTDSASGSGGGIYISEGSMLKLYNTEVATNTTQSNDNSAAGGGIAASDSVVNINNQSAIYNNSAEEAGGGIYLHSSVLAIYNSTVASNTVTSGDNYSRGGGIYVRNESNNKKAVTLANSNIFNNSAKYRGGGIYIENSSNTTINNNTHIHHNAISSGTMNDGGGGGGLHIRGTNSVSIDDIEVDHNSITDSHNSYEGGGIHADNNGNFTLQNSYIHDNNASDNGGGLHIDGCDNATIANARFTNNHAGPSDNVGQGGGGGVEIVDSTGVIFNNNILAGNRADKAGGAMLINSADVTLRNNTIADNGNNNSAIYVVKGQSENPDVNLYNTIVTTQSIGINRATSAGSVNVNGILWQGVSTHTTGSTVSIVSEETTNNAAIFLDHIGYHLTASSPAIDKAVSAQATTTDIDGELRPAGYRDLGADEYPYSFQFVHRATKSNAFPGELITYTVRITNTGSQALTNVALNVPASALLATPFTVTQSSPGGSTYMAFPPNLASNMSIGYQTTKIVTYTAQVIVPTAHELDIINNATVTANNAKTPPSQSVTVDVNNAPPVALPNTFNNISENSGQVAYNVIGNDSDVNGDTLNVTRVGTPSNGGSAGFSGANVLFNPTNKTGNYTTIFTYTVSDGALSDTEWVTFSVLAVNEPPIARTENLTATEDNNPRLYPSLRGNDEDPEGISPTIQYVSPPILKSGGLPIGAQVGTTGIAAGNVITYKPQNRSQNYTAAFSYTISDGVLTGWVTDTVVVTADDDAPTVRNDGYNYINENEPVTIQALLNDLEPDADQSKRILTLSAPPVGYGSAITQNVSGTDVVYYTPTDRRMPYSTNFNYTMGSVAQNRTATIYVTITVAGNDPIVATDFADSTPEETTLVIPLVKGIHVNDPDYDDVFTVTNAVNNNPGVTGNVVYAKHTITYTPKLNYNGTTYITYTVRDIANTTSVGHINVSVTPVNDPIAATDFASSTLEEVTLVVPLVKGIHVNDPDVGDIFTVTNAVNNNPGVTGNIVYAKRTITYTPKLNYNGTTYITYTVRDIANTTSVGHINVSVIPVNDPIAATDFTSPTLEDTTLVVPLIKGIHINDPDVGDIFTITNAVNNNPGVTGNVVYAKHTITYTPELNYNGTTYITYTVRDIANTTSVGHINVPITPVNDPIEAKNFTANATKGLTATLDTTPHVLDPDPGANYTIIGVTVPTGKGRYTISGKSINYNSESFSGTVVLTYTVQTVGSTDTDNGLITVSVASSLASFTPPADERLTTTNDDTIPHRPPSALHILSGKTLTVWRRMAGARLRQR